MLAGLAGSALAVGWRVTLVAFAVAGGVFATALATVTVAIGRVGAGSLKELRLSGPAVRRWSGYVLVMIALWFAVLAVLPRPPLA